MWHATCTQGNQGDSRLVVIGSQIDNLTLGPSFGHNLCFMYPNESCKPILDIKVPRAFQWYKEFFNPMSFDPCNHPLKIRKSIGTSTPKMGAHLGVWGSFLHTFLHSWEHEMWLPSSFLALTFANPCLGREPKARVVTTKAKACKGVGWKCEGMNPHTPKWTLKFLKSSLRGQNSLDWKFSYTIRIFLKHKCLKLAHMIHLST
jgi:hypothetical protein